MISRSLLISCLSSVLAYAAPITILEKQLALGKDPKTQKTLMAKGYSFTEGDSKESVTTRWVTVFPYENELIFYTTQNGIEDCFPVTNIITTQPSFDVPVDPSAQNPIMAKQPVKTAEPALGLASMHVTIAPDVQLFKELLILIAKGNVKALTALINKHTLKTVEETIDKALSSQGECFISCDDLNALESLMQTKTPITKPVTLTGQLIFAPLQELLEQVLAEEAEQLEQNKANAQK